MEITALCKRLSAALKSISIKLSQQTSIGLQARLEGNEEYQFPRTFSREELIDIVHFYPRQLVPINVANYGATHQADVSEMRAVTRSYESVTRLRNV